LQACRWSAALKHAGGEHALVMEGRVGGSGKWSTRRGASREPEAGRTGGA
jgi:hypothetical protein